MSPHALPLLAQRLINRPLAVLPSKADMIVAVLAERLGISHIAHGGLVRPVMMDDDDEWGLNRQRAMRDPGYDLISGVAHIEISGTLVQKLGSVRPYSGMTGYDGIRQSFLAALADPQADAIMLCIDSPGGEVAGCFDLVDTIYAARGIKPIWAVLNEVAFSAAYAIASAADVITVPRTGGTGSIGVIALHMDMSRALDADGLTVTIISYGEKKAHGIDVAPLSDSARQALQADIDAMGELFVATVARNRGMSAGAVRDQQAATFLGEAGLTAALADYVGAPSAAFSALISTLEGTT